MLKMIQDRYPFVLPETWDVRRAKGFKIKGRLYLHLDTEFVWPNPALPVLGESGTCMGLQNHFGILADGTVVPCCLDSEGRIPLGDLKTTPLEEVLSAPRTVAILDGFKKSKLVEDLCQRCSYARRFQVDRVTSKSKKPVIPTIPAKKYGAPTSLISAVGDPK